MTNNVKLVLPALTAIFLFPLLPVRAQDAHEIQQSNPQMKAALDLVVTRQLAAFGAGNFSLAYTYAASGIQKVYPLVEFERMVRAGYPIMLTSPKVDFGVALDDGQTGVVFAEMTGTKGKQVFRYLLTHETIGWKITGVEEVEEAKSTKPPITA